MRKYLLTIISLQLLTLFSVMGYKAYAATSYTVYNVPYMTLDGGISATATTGIVLSPPVRNGEDVSYPATGGGILEFKWANYVEYIYYSSASVNATTKKITLSGVVRGYCWNQNIWASCETGRIWAKGTRVTLVNDMRLYNFSAKLDIANTFSGANAIKFSNSGSFTLPTFANATSRDHNIPSPADGMKVYMTDTSTEMLYSGGAWVQASSGSVVNAGYANSGKVECATPSELAISTASGSSNAPLVACGQDYAVTGATTASGHVAVTNTSGVLNASIGGTGTGTTSMGSGAILTTQKGNRMKPIYPGTNGNVITSNGTEWVSSSATFGKKLYSNTAASSAFSSTSTGSYGLTYDIAANSLAAGDIIDIYTAINTEGLAYSGVAYVYFDSIIIAKTNTTDMNTTPSLTIRCTVRTIGGSGTMYCKGFSMPSGAVPLGITGAQYTIDTTQALTVDVKGYKQSGANSSYLQILNIIKY